MKNEKTVRNSSKGQVKYSSNTWKIKAIFRREENTKLVKRIKELRQSRDSWKTKYMDLKYVAKQGKGLSAKRAFRHHYNLDLVMLILALYQYGTMSLRACRHSLFCMLICLGLESRLPSHTSIRNWLCKSGYYRIQERQNQGGDYVLYVDELSYLEAKKSY